MSNIIIKNLRDEKPKEKYQIRVDRQSVLGNPFYLVDKNNIKERNIVCDKYEKYFYEQLECNKYFYRTILYLETIYKIEGKLELFCWCAPKRCHAETIKKYLEEKIGTK